MSLCHISITCNIIISIWIMYTHCTKNTYSHVYFVCTDIAKSWLTLFTYLEEIPISGWFVTQLDIGVVAQTPHIYNKPIQTPKKLCTIERSQHLRGDWAWPLNDWLSTTAERSIKHLHWTISLALIKLPPAAKIHYYCALLNNWFRTEPLMTDQVTPESPVTVSYPKMHYYCTTA